MSAPDPLLSLLCDRNRFMREADEHSADEPEMNRLLDRAIALEKAILDTPAVSVGGFAAKLMLHIETVLEGFTPSGNVLAALIREGRETFAIGDFINPALELEAAE